MTLPSELLKAVSDPNGGKIVLVTGAGTSIEPPTAIPLAWQCSSDAHGRLIADGVLDVGDCNDPFDLSALADAVVKKTKSQEALVSRLPIEPMRNAKPNDGHLIAIALMIEGAITNIVTLNYDLAFSNAISELGIRNGIAIIRGPEHHNQLGQKNIIYLHRSVDASMETWVLTTSALEEEWKSGWEELMVAFVGAAPFVVFAGLGSSCGVLTHSCKKIRKAVGSRVRTLLVGPNDPAGSKFIKETEIDPNDCIKSGWVAFMRVLGKRYLQKVGQEVLQASIVMARREGWIDSNGAATENISSLVDRLINLDIVALSIVRARWHLWSDVYTRTDERQVVSLADILIAIRLVEGIGNSTANLLQCGRVRFTLQNNREVDIVVVSGTGGLRWGSLEATLKHCENYLRAPKPSQPARRVLAVEVTGMKPENMATPESIIDGRAENDILQCGESIRFWSSDEIRLNPLLVSEILS